MELWPFLINHTKQKMLKIFLNGAKSVRIISSDAAQCFAAKNVNVMHSINKKV